MCIVAFVVVDGGGGGGVRVCVCVWGGGGGDCLRIEVREIAGGVTGGGIGGRGGGGRTFTPLEGKKAANMQHHQNPEQRI